MATENLIPVLPELGGKGPNSFFSDVMPEDDGFLDKAAEGFVLFAFNQGEACTCPSRALIQEDIWKESIAHAIEAGRVWGQQFPRRPGACGLRRLQAIGIGRENRKLMLDHCQQTKNLLMSYSPNKRGFF